MDSDITTTQLATCTCIHGRFECETFSDTPQRLRLSNKAYLTRRPRYYPSYSSPQKSPSRYLIPVTSYSANESFIVISFAISMTLVISSLICAFSHESITEPKVSNPNSLASISDEALRTVCSVTRYPDSCFSSVSPLNTPPTNNPIRFFNLSLQASLLETSNLTTLPTNLLTESKSGPALKDCSDLFANAASQLTKSSELMKVKPGEKVLTEMKISDIQTWISEAMTDQETCLDGLEEMASTAVDELKRRVHKSQEYMSNTLEILNNIGSLFDKFGLTNTMPALKKKRRIPCGCCVLTF